MGSVGQGAVKGSVHKRIRGQVKGGQTRMLARAHEGRKLYNWGMVTGRGGRSPSTDARTTKNAHLRQLVLVLLLSSEAS